MFMFACSHCLGTNSADQGGVQYLMKSANISVVRAVQRKQPDGTWVAEEYTSNVACRCDVADIESDQ